MPNQLYDNGSVYDWRTAAGLASLGGAGLLGHAMLKKRAKRKKRRHARRRQLETNFAGYPQNYRSSSGQAWLQGMLRMIIASRQLVVSATPLTELVITNASTPFIGYRSMRELVTACYSAVQGESRKSYVQGSLNGTLVNIANGTAAAGIPVFGWRIRLTASVLNFAYRPILIDIGPILNTGGTVFTVPNPVVSFAVQSRRLPVDIFVISPANAAGLATIVPGTQDDITATTTTTARSGVLIRTLSDANTFGIIETLNARDLVARATSFGELCASDEDDDEVGPGTSSDEEGFYSGIRDEG